MNRPHVLIVDDSAVVRQAFSMLLVQQFSVDTAADPLIAERKIRKRRPDVVVLDLQMPRMDGFTFLRQTMRTDPLPVVICSAAASHAGSTCCSRNANCFGSRKKCVSFVQSASIIRTSSSRSLQTRS